MGLAIGVYLVCGVAFTLWFWVAKWRHCRERIGARVLSLGTCVVLWLPMVLFRFGYWMAERWRTPVMVPWRGDRVWRDSVRRRWR